ncbi:MAG: hypothetical protein QOK11_3162, partial [Pseudonocardiales bacterium]|nr:hypothetical protein [Pseudonocardiales bacterium]
MEFATWESMLLFSTPPISVSSMSTSMISVYM